MKITTIPAVDPDTIRQQLRTKETVSKATGLPNQQGLLSEHAAREDMRGADLLDWLSDQD